MQDQAFAASTRPAARVILRLPLLDYSIGHELLLQQSGNILLTEANEAPHPGRLEVGDTADWKSALRSEQIAAVMNAVLICSRTWEQNKRPDRWVRFWGWMIRREDFPLAIAEFRNHRDEGSSFPRILPMDGADRQGRELGAPFMSRLLAYAGKIFGESAFDQPLGLVQWMYFAQAESEGSCRVENAFECQVREETEQHQEDYRKEQELILQKQTKGGAHGVTRPTTEGDECRH